MKSTWIVAAVLAAAVVLRLWLRSRRRARRAAEAAPAAPAHSGSAPVWLRVPRSPVAMVASREIRERVSGRIFKVGTVVVLLVVVGAILLPRLTGSSGPSIQTVGVVGSISGPDLKALAAAGTVNHDRVHFRRFGSTAAADAALRAGRIDVSILDGDELVLWEPATARSSPADPGFITVAATYLGELRAYGEAKLTPSQADHIEHAAPLPVRLLVPGSEAKSNGVSIFGLVLLFFMLQTYDTWILIGVMQEKASRVVEVLLSTVRPIQLLAGKVAGIGIVALGQALLVVAAALLTEWAVGSNVLRGTGLEVLGCQLLWLLLGYAFYCWVYAAAGSTAERQDQVQTVALPLSIPVLVAYIFSITVASSGNADAAFKVLAYLPPTAPFCMPVLVGLGDVSWWQFLASVCITLASIVVAARLAARIYQRAILHTRGRVRLREIVAAARGSS